MRTAATALIHGHRTHVDVLNRIDDEVHQVILLHPIP
jgi:hypothetical protein